MSQEKLANVTINVQVEMKSVGRKYLKWIEKHSAKKELMTFHELLDIIPNLKDRRYSIVKTTAQGAGLSVVDSMEVNIKG